MLWLRDNRRPFSEGGSLAGEDILDDDIGEEEVEEGAGVGAGVEAAS